MIAYFMADDALRLVSFMLALFGSVLLVFVNWRRLHKLTRGEIVVREGLFALLVSVVYGTGEFLWHWPHWRLYILTVATSWVFIGLIWMTCERVLDRQDRRNSS